ncbi:MAG TPA: hypothetical protein VHP33_24010 [Polyangiaceae bacterium]|nr:hypothetical protein [Polyangiaceae bacterium]
MTELDRLLNQSESSRTRALLRAGKAETSPDGFSDKLLVGVGAALAASVVSSAAAASLAAGASATSAGSATSGVGAAVGNVGAAVGSGAAPSLVLVAAKWVAVGVLGGGILAAGADFALSPDREPERAPQAVSANVDLGNAAEPRPPAPLVTPRVAPTASAQPKPLNSPPTAAHGSSAPPSASANASRLGREVQLIDRARRALSVGNTSLALSELDAYQRIATTGVLDREARVLRIRALREGGDEAGARKLSDQYLRDFPGDPHAKRLQAQDTKAKP